MFGHPGFNVETVKYKNLRFDCWDAGGQAKFRRLWHHYCQNSQVTAHTQHTAHTTHANRTHATHIGHDADVVFRAVRCVLRVRCARARQGVIFVIDSTDHDRLSEARDELHRIMKEDSLENTLVLVLANKQGACRVRCVCRVVSCVVCRVLTEAGPRADMPKALSKEEIAEALALSSLSKKWHIEATCATTGEGKAPPPLSNYTAFVVPCLTFVGCACVRACVRRVLRVCRVSCVVWCCAAGLYDALDWLVAGIQSGSSK